MGCWAAAAAARRGRGLDEAAAFRASGCGLTRPCLTVSAAPSRTSPTVAYHAMITDDFLRRQLVKIIRENQVKSLLDMVKAAARALVGWRDGYAVGETMSRGRVSVRCGASLSSRSSCWW